MPASAGDATGDQPIPVRVKLLGPFSISLGDRRTGRWERPPARRLCQLLLLAPGRRMTREAVIEALFPDLEPAAASSALSKALSHARSALTALGPQGRDMLQANLTHAWMDLGSAFEVDLEVQQGRLKAALEAAPGTRRDDLVQLAVADEGTLVEEEPYAAWALRPRDHLDWARQEARLVLARDRARGHGRSTLEAVVSAWEDCLPHDPTCEEAAAALMRLYGAQKRYALVESTYNRCREALEQLGLSVPPALEALRSSTTPDHVPPQDPVAKRAGPKRYPEERRLVSVLFAELSGPSTGGARLSPEDLCELVGGALARVVAEVESLGGTVTSVSGAGLVAIFGAPESHEDDPERALRAAFRAVSSAGTAGAGLLLRAGVESGPAVVGPIEAHGVAHYAAVGEVVGAAAALQSGARPGSVLVGPATHAVAEGLFEWGPGEDVVAVPGAKPLKGRYLERP